MAQHIQTASGRQAAAAKPESLFSNRNFRLLAIGQLISALGDQFYLVAIPWLALQMTGSALTAGTVLAVASVPRALFMLLGGAVTDRFSARKVLLAANGLQAVFIGLLSLVVLSGRVELWLVYLVALATGFADAFSYPAVNTILPQIVEPEQLEGGNTLVQGANMASVVIGPALAGLLIAFFAGQGAAGASLTGIGLALLIDVVTFLVGITFLWLIRPRRTAAAQPEGQSSVIRSMLTGVRVMWADDLLRGYFILILALGLFFNGTIAIGLPVLASLQLPGGASTLGLLHSAFGGGMLLGMLLVNLLPRPSQRYAGLVMGLVYALLPVGLILLGFSTQALTAAAIALVMGLANGYVNITLITWLQRRTPAEMLGRIMGVVMFASIGLEPVSQALAGALLDYSLVLTFSLAGGIVLLLVAFTLSRRRMWALD